MSDKEFKELFDIIVAGAVSMNIPLDNAVVSVSNVLMQPDRFVFELRFWQHFQNVKNNYAFYVSDVDGKIESLKRLVYLHLSGLCREES